MNRRKFLSWLAIAPVVAAAAPTLKLLVPIEKAQDGYRTYITGKNAVIETDPDTINEYKRKRAEGGPGSWVSYRYHMTTTLPPNTNYRLRFVDSK